METIDAIQNLRGAARGYIYALLKQEDLVAFIEQEAQVKFSKGGDRFLCKCPLHRDKTPSFYVTKHDNTWLFNCFGCGKGGTIIDFYKEYHSLEFAEDAMLALCKRFNIADANDAVIRAIKEMKVEVNHEERLECAHIQASSACHTLLREFAGNKKVEGWVSMIYRRMNEVLANKDIATVRRVTSLAMQIMVDKGDVHEWQKI